RQVGRRRAREPDRGDIDTSPVLFAVGGQSATRAEARLTHPRRPIVPPRVPVQMKLQFSSGLRGDIAPGDEFSAGDRTRASVERRVDSVVGVARAGFKIVGGIDIDCAKVGRDLGDVVGLSKRVGVKVSDDAGKAIKSAKPDVVVLCTSSSIKKVMPQIETVLKSKVPIVSTT